MKLMFLVLVLVMLADWTATPPRVKPPTPCIGPGSPCVPPPTPCPADPRT